MLNQDTEAEQMVQINKQMGEAVEQIALDLERINKLNLAADVPVEVHDNREKAVCFTNLIPYLLCC